MLRLFQLSVVLLAAFLQHSEAFATPQVNSLVEANVLREWLLVGDRFCSSAATIEVDDTTGKCMVITTRKVSPGEVLFRLGKNAVWSDAYKDRDLGPKLKDFAVQAGPGFGVVSLAGGVGAERVRRFRSREGLGVAPESSGFTVPSKWGAYARWLWSNHDEKDVSIDESLAGVVNQGVNLLVPLLDMTARRYWTTNPADEPETSVVEEEWTRKALLDDGAPQSLSRSDLESVALNSMAMVLEEARSPPPFLLDGSVGSLVPDPFIDEKSDPPESWPTGENLAFVPLMSDLDLGGSEKTNAVIGSPPRNRHGGEDDCVWCVATKRLDVGECVVAKDPSL